MQAHYQLTNLFILRNNTGIPLFTNIPYRSESLQKKSVIANIAIYLFAGSSCTSRPLGMTDGTIKDWQLAASSALSRADDPQCAVKFARKEFMTSNNESWIYKSKKISWKWLCWKSWNCLLWKKSDIGILMSFLIRSLSKSKQITFSWHQKRNHEFYNSRI